MGTTDLSSFAVATVAVVILGLSKGGFAGFGMVSTPLLAVVVGPVRAAGLIFPILLVQDAVTIWIYRRRWSRPIVAAMAPGAAFGVWAGYALAAHVSEAAVALSLGLISLAFALRQLRGRAGAETPPAAHPHRLLGAFAGAAAGLTSMIAHAGTPPFQLYVMPQRLDRDLYVGTSVAFFATLNLMKLPAFVALGQMTPANLANAALLVPVAILSSWQGARLVRRVDPARFARAITLILIAVSVGLIAQGIARWP